MTEDDARAWLNAVGFMEGLAGERLEWLVAATLEEADRQNLISSGTRSSIWARHIVDSAQLLAHCEEAHDGLWLDIGTGAGFPGLVVACLSDRPILLVEPRPLRVAHLERCIAELTLNHCSVFRGSIAQVQMAPAAYISARAYAPLPRIFATSGHCSDLSTVWLLPKGRNAEKELATAAQEWQGVFHVKQSVTDPEARIVVASGVEQRQKKPVQPRKAEQHSRRRNKARP